MSENLLRRVARLIRGETPLRLFDFSLRETHELKIADKMAAAVPHFNLLLGLGKDLHLLVIQNEVFHKSNPPHQPNDPTQTPAHTGVTVMTRTTAYRGAGLLQWIVRRDAITS
jgi:hypothetical protein